LAKVTWTEPALADVGAIKNWIADTSPEIADAFSDRLIDSTVRLGSFPSSGRVVPEKNLDNIREVIFGRYRIIYAFSESEVEILTVIHGARILDPKDLPQ
jgi:toxin ParE1/3/4